MASNPTNPNPNPNSQSAPVLPIQFTQFHTDDFKSDSGVSLLNNIFSQIQVALNQSIGASGPTPLPSGANLSGAPISNLGEPQSPTDAISKSHAETHYSAAALAPQLEAGGQFPLKTMRWLNSKSQQESYSTFLNRVSNTAPTCNTSVISGTVSGGNVEVTVSAGYHKFMDGSIVPYAAYFDTEPLPTTQSITSLSRSGGVVTATGTFTGLTPGESVYIGDASDPSFDGTFVLSAVSSTTITWNQPNEPDATTTGGTVSTGSIFHYFLRNPSHTLAVAGPFAVDSQENRLDSNIDQQVLIAVAAISSSGLVTDQSAAGATPPASTANIRLLTRL